MDRELIRALIREARQAVGFSYAPYSNFNVGAALLTDEGRIFSGCNIENAAYSPGNCAERTAFFKAISEGYRKFSAICIMGGKEAAQTGLFAEYAPPCGVCRQVMMEFCEPDEFIIILATDEEHFDLFTLKELLPRGFGPANLD